MDPFTLLGWTASGISLTGSVLNARMNIHGYTLWLCSNAIWMVYDVSLGLWEQLPMFAVSTVLAAYGIAEWRKRRTINHAPKGVGISGGMRR